MALTHNATQRTHRIIHPNLDRLFAWRRQSSRALDETWGYDHAVSNVASDTKVVCDWSNVESDLDMPVCAKGTWS